MFKLSEGAARKGFNDVIDEENIVTMLPGHIITGFPGNIGVRFVGL